MVAVTFGIGRVPTVEAASKAGPTQTDAPRKRWYVRVFDALIEARMEKARREIRMYTTLMPYTFDERGNRLVKTDSGNLPFGGW